MATQRIQLVHLGSITADVERRELRRDGRVVKLRELEARLLGRLHQDRGEVVDRDTLFREVFGYAAGAQSRTLDSTVQRLRRKLKGLDDTPFVQTVYGQGYRLVANEYGIDASRSYEYQQIAEVIRTRSTLVVLGPGGIGKTTLVQTCLTNVDGVVWVDCRGESLLGPMAEHLGAAEGSDMDGIAAILRERSPTVVVIDNAEWVRDQVRSLAALDVALILVSRLPLSVPHALSLVVPGLEEQAARALFVAHAGPQVEDRVLAALLQVLNGNPLAIQYAAYRARHFDLTSLLAELTERVDVLLGSADTPKRQRSLRAILQTTVAMLNPTEREVLDLLSLVGRPFSLSDIQSLIGAQRLDIVEGLLDVGILTAVSVGRFDLHRPLKELLQTDNGPSPEQRAAWLGWLTSRCRASLPRLANLPSIAVLSEAIQHLPKAHPGRFEIGYALVLGLRAKRRSQRIAADWLPSLAPPSEGRDHVLLNLCNAEIQAALSPPQTTAATDAVNAAKTLGNAWVQHALHKRARIRVVLRDADQAKQDLFAMEEVAAEIGESAVPLAWLDSAALLGDVGDRESCVRRLRRIEPTLGQLSGHNQVRWYRVWTAITFEQMDFRACRERCMEMVDVANQHGLTDMKAQGLTLLAAAQSELGEHQRAMESGQNAAAIITASSNRWQVICWGNQSTNHQFRLDFSEAMRCASRAVAVAGTDPRTQRLASARLLTLERVMGFSGSTTVPNRQIYLGQSDHEHVLWWAQSGDLETGITKAEDLLRPGHTEAFALYHRIALAELYIAAHRPDDARIHLEFVRAELPTDHVWYAPFSAACRVVGIRLPRQRARTPFHGFLTGCWDVVWLAEHRPDEARARFDELGEILADVNQGPYSELAWRHRVARDYLEGHPPTPT